MSLKNLLVAFTIVLCLGCSSEVPEPVNDEPTRLMVEYARFLDAERASLVDDSDGYDIDSFNQLNNDYLSKIRQHQEKNEGRNHSEDYETAQELVMLRWVTYLFACQFQLSDHPESSFSEDYNALFSPAEAKHWETLEFDQHHGEKFADIMARYS